MIGAGWRVARGVVDHEALAPVAYEASMLRPGAMAIARRFQSRAGAAAGRLLEMQAIADLAGQFAGPPSFIWYDRPGCALDPVKEPSGDTPYFLMLVASEGPPSPLLLWDGDDIETKLILAPGDVLLFQPGLIRHARPALVSGQSLSLILVERKAIPSISG